jgi:hypothetical protein
MIELVRPRLPGKVKEKKISELQNYCGTIYR